MKTHKCTIYGLNGAGTRMVIEVPAYIESIAPSPSTASPNVITVETVIKTRKPKSASLNIKPTNGLKLALGR